MNEHLESNAGDPIISFNNLPEMIKNLVDSLKESAKNLNSLKSAADALVEKARHTQNSSDALIAAQAAKGYEIATGTFQMLLKYAANWLHPAILEEFGFKVEIPEISTDKPSFELPDSNSHVTAETLQALTANLMDAANHFYTTSAHSAETRAKLADKLHQCEQLLKDA